MFFLEELEKYKNENIKLFVDMDGVIADYNVGSARDYDKKRPLYNSINLLKKVSELDNVTLYILSISRFDIGVDEKNKWLDKYASFFKKENRMIISRESNNMERSAKLKWDFIKKLDFEDNLIMVIDDDPEVLHGLMNQNRERNLKLYKDTVLID